MFGWSKKHVRDRLVATPFPAGWSGILSRNVKRYSGLNEMEQSKLRHDLRLIIAEKNWEGCSGLALNDEVKVTIAAQVSYGWGMIPVTARIGRTEWTTSLFPKDGAYVVPVKASVRKTEGISDGDVVSVRLGVGRPHHDG